MKLTIKIFLAFAGLLVAPAAQAMGQKPVAQAHAKEFFKFVDLINEAKTDAQAIPLTQGLLLTKTSDTIKQLFDKLLAARIEDHLGNPRIHTLDRLAKEDALRKKYNKFSTEQQAEFIALNLCAVANQQASVAQKKAFEKDLTQISDAMTREIEAAKDAWREHDRKHKSSENLKEQRTIAAKRAQKIHEITQKHDKTMLDLIRPHAQRIIFPQQRHNQSHHLTPAVDGLD